jgi:hypothetical protein
LRRAKEELLMCLALFPLLRDAGHFSAELCGVAQARLNQILVGIDDLSSTPIDGWLKLRLPTLPPVPKASHADRLALQKRIDEAAMQERLFPQPLRPVAPKRQTDLEPAAEEQPSDDENVTPPAVADGEDDSAAG